MCTHNPQSPLNKGSLSIGETFPGQFSTQQGGRAGTRPKAKRATGGGSKASPPPSRGQNIRSSRQGAAPAFSVPGLLQNLQNTLF